MSTEDKVIGCTLFFVFYFIMGVVSSYVLSAAAGIPNIDHLGTPETLAWMIFWPVFVLKYTGIGVWNILVSFYNLITL